jgi:hypothetical protein
LPDIEELIIDCDIMRPDEPDFVAVAPLLKPIEDVNNEAVRTTIPA